MWGKCENICLDRHATHSNRASGGDIFYQNQVHLVFIKVVYPILIVPPFCLPNGLECFFLDLQYLLFLFPSWFEFWPPEGSKLRSFNDETLVNGWKFSKN